MLGPGYPTCEECQNRFACFFTKQMLLNTLFNNPRDIRGFHLPEIPRLKKSSCVYKVYELHKDPIGKNNNIINMNVYFKETFVHEVFK